MNDDTAVRHGAADRARKVINAAILANLGIAAAKFVVAAITGSAAMMAEGIHSAVDTGNELLLMVGEKMSRRDPDLLHPFGHGKAIYFWALLVALSMFTLGAGLSIYHGVHKLLEPAPLANPFWNYVVLTVAAVFESFSWNLSRRALNRYRRPGASLWQAVRASKDASVFTVFVEDSTALIGIVIAATGIGLGHLTGSPWFDPAASIAIGLLLIAAAFTLARENGELLVGESMGREQMASLREIFEAEPCIETMDRLRTMQLGPDEVLLTATVRFRRGMRIEELEQAIARLEQAVSKVSPAIRHIYFESEALRPAMH